MCLGARAGVGPVHVSAPTNPDFALNDWESVTEAEQITERPPQKGEHTEAESHLACVSQPQHLAPRGSFQRLISSPLQPTKLDSSKGAWRSTYNSDVLQVILTGTWAGDP